MTAMSGDKGGVIYDPPPAPIGWLNISARIGLMRKKLWGGGITLIEVLEHGIRRANKYFRSY